VEETEGNGGTLGEKNLSGYIYRQIIDIYGLTTIDDHRISWWCAHADRMEDVDKELG
jgi:hypothetical protein